MHIRTYYYVHSDNSSLLLPSFFAEDNLLQLAEIHENIQRMRLENAAEASAAAGGAGTGAGPGAQQQPRMLTLGATSSRLSSSCPSLNNEGEQGGGTEENE